MNPLDPNYNAAAAESSTLPFFLVRLAWDTAAYYTTTNASINWNSENWLPFGLEVKLGRRPRLTFFNEDNQFGALVLAEGTAGRRVDIYQGLENDVSHPNPKHVFTGVMGPATIEPYVSIECKRFDPTKNYYCTQPVFNWLPKNNERIETPGGVYRIEVK